MANKLLFYYSGIPIFQALNFFEPPVYSNQNSLPLDLMSMSPLIFQTPDVSNQFLFSLEVQKIGIALYMHAYQPYWALSMCKIEKNFCSKMRPVGLINTHIKEQ